MEKLKALLKKLGVKAATIESYLTDDAEKLKALDPEKDGSEIFDAIRAVHRNEIEDDIKKEAEKTSRAHVYGEVEGFFMKEGGFKKEDLIASGTAEPKWKDFGNFFKKKLSESAKPDDKSKGTIAELQEQLRLANEKAVALETEVTTAKDSANKAIEEYKSGIHKETTLIDHISKMEKKTILPPNKVLKLINDKISTKYALVQNTDGSFEIRDKANPEKKVNKSATEFMTLNDALEKAIEEEELFVKSNGGDDRKKEDMKQEDKKPDKPERTLPASALAVERANEEQFANKD